jgi:CRISPR-associated protein Cas6
MYWQDEKEEESVPIPEDVVDLTFRIRCASLPVDHAYALYEALAPLIPWLAHETGAGIHPIHVAESAHGWMRPEKPNDLLHLAHRTRLVLRLPATRLEDARNLTGHTVMVAGHELRIYKADVRPLSAGTSLFARRVVIREDEEEQEFVHRMYAELQETGIYAKKLLPGKEHQIRTPSGIIRVHLLSVEGMSVTESLLLQRTGLGPYRYLGCGIFIPQKPMA